MNERSPTIRRLPSWLTPLEQNGRGNGQLRLIETTVLILFALLLAVATVNDLRRQVHVNGRLNADLLTWRTVTHRNYHNLSVQQDIQSYTSRDVVCGNVRPGPPGVHDQICLIMTGPVRSSMRATHGGYFLPPHKANVALVRYGCFGSARSARLCPSHERPSGHGERRG